MARRLLKPHSDTSTYLQELQELLTDFAREIERPDLRERVQALVPSFAKLRELGVSLMPDHVASSARERILAYLRRYPLTVIDGDELMVVSGIGEWARRVRELRVEFGWLINSGSTFKDLASEAESEAESEADGARSLGELATVLGMDPRTMRPEQYVLVSDVQDRDAAFRWNLLNEIRKTKLSVQDKILRYLRQNAGKPVLGEELRYLAKDRSEWARRVRELRTEEGWPIASRQSGRPDLPVGVYVLERDQQAAVHDRKIPDPVRVQVLTRDHHSCRFPECGWRREMAAPDDPRRYLELHHIIRHMDKGKNVPENLITLCNVHHDDVHRRKEAADLVAAIKL
ncbi:HNH endonuclease [Paradevosia shaoguanensis]|uniref:HNH endonuclease n=1 Tax=Paradevosia shaoguanensis TaxID=1335043 RepID=UPI003C73871C